MRKMHMRQTLSLPIFPFPADFHLRVHPSVRLPARPARSTCSRQLKSESRKGEDAAKVIMAFHPSVRLSKRAIANVVRRTRVVWASVCRPSLTASPRSKRDKERPSNSSLALSYGTWEHASTTLPVTDELIYDMTCPGSSLFSFL